MVMISGCGSVFFNEEENVYYIKCHRYCVTVIGSSINI